MKKNTYRRLSKYPGVYIRESEERVHEGKPDICFDISYKREGRKIWEKAGWASEGYSARLASQIRAERLRMIRHGQELPKEKAKIPRFCEMWELYSKWADENKGSDRNDGYRYKHLEGLLGEKRLDEISSFDLERVKSDMMKKGLAAATIKHVLVLVREIYNKAMAWRKFQGTNPVRGVKMPSLNNRRERFLSHEEADKLLMELGKVSKTAHDMALISLHCGLRAGEIFNLRGQDLDFQNGIINIADPKNKHSRKAYMTQATKEILRARLPKNPGDLVFKDRKNGNMIRRVSGAFQRTADPLFNKGVKDRRQRVVFHTLRHTFGSWLAIQGTPVLTIKELLGHRSLAMTERYAHLIPDVKKEATLALERSFNESRTGKKVISIAKEIEPQRNPG